MDIVTITKSVVTGVTITLNLDEAEQLRRTIQQQPATNLNCDLYEALCDALDVA